jgi:hypothetical protein
MLDADFFHTHKKKIIIGLISCMLISFLIPFTIALITRARMKPAFTEISGEEVENTEERQFSISDLYLDEIVQDSPGASFYLLRDRFKRWNKEQVDNYFIAPRIIIIETFTQYNDKYIREFFNKID